MAPTGPGSGTSALYVTHNFATFTRISLPTLPATIRAQFSFVPDVSFATSTIGWAVDVSPGSGVYLFETSDGGRRWSYVREIHPEANGAFGWVRFVSATVGWVGAGDIGANGPSTVLRTDDGGRSWQALPGIASTGSSATPYFVSSTVGFVHGVFGPGGSTQLLMTSDGGSTWSPVAFPVDASVRGTAFPALPRMTGTDGVLPLLVTPQPSELTSGEPAPVVVAFDTTTNGGSTWSAGPSLHATAVTGFSTVQSTAGWIAAGPAAAAASSSDWWVLLPKRTGKVVVRVSHDAGATWTTEPGTGLPTIHVASVLHQQINTPLVLQAVTSRIALLLVETSPQGWSTYLTTDGGATWSLLTPVSLTVLPVTRELVTPNVRVSPSKDLVDGETVQVHISGFGANGRYHISECLDDADVSEAGCGVGLAIQPTVATGRAGNGAANFVVSSSAAPSSDTTTSGAGCTNQCVLVVSGGLGHGLAFAHLTFRRR